MHNGTAFYRIIWWFLIKLNILFVTVQSSHHASLCLPKGDKNLYPYKNLYRDVYSSFIHNCPKLGSNQDIFQQMKTNKLWYTQTMEYYSWLKRNALSNIKRYKETSWVSERIQSEKATYYVITIKWHSIKGKIMETVKRSVVVRGWGEGRDEQGEHRELLRQWNYSVWYHNDGYMPLCILCICLNPQTIYNTKNER